MRPLCSTVARTHLGLLPAHPAFGDDVATGPHQTASRAKSKTAANRSSPWVLGQRPDPSRGHLTGCPVPNHHRQLPQPGRRPDYPQPWPSPRPRTQCLGPSTGTVETASSNWERGMGSSSSTNATTSGRHVRARVKGIEARRWLGLTTTPTGRDSDHGPRSRDRHPVTGLSDSPARSAAPARSSSQPTIPTPSSRENRLRCATAESPWANAAGRSSPASSESARSLAPRPDQHRR